MAGVDHHAAFGLPAVEVVAKAATRVKSNSTGRGKLRWAVPSKRKAVAAFGPTPKTRSGRRLVSIEFALRPEPERSRQLVTSPATMETPSSARIQARRSPL